MNIKRNLSKAAVLAVGATMLMATPVMAKEETPLLPLSVTVTTSGARASGTITLLTYRMETSFPQLARTA